MAAKLIGYLYRQAAMLLLVAMVCAIISGLSGATLIRVVNAGIDSQAVTAALALQFFTLIAVTVLARSAAQIAILHLSQAAAFDMRVELSRKLLATPHERLQALGKPGLLAILTRDIETFVGALQVLPRMLTDATIVLACFGYIAWLSRPLFGMLAVTLVLGMTVFMLAQRYPLAKLKIIRAKMDLLFRHFRDLVEGSRELQLNRQRGVQFVDGVIAVEARSYRSVFIRGFGSFIWISNIGDALFYLAIGVLLFVVPLWMPQPAAVRTSVTLTLLYLIGPIASMINAVPAVGQAAVSLSKIEQLGANLSADACDDGIDPFQRDADVLLDLRAVSHQYPSEADDAPFMLGPLNLRVQRGEILFIVGGNGSGKTTLAMLLLGLYKPETGQVHLNGEAVHDANLHHYRQHFSAVFADFHLFEQLLGVEGDAAGAAALPYLEKLGMGRKVSIVDGKFSTIALSSGQRKRLALLVSYLEDKSIYLFDEWAADQDTVFKRVFYTELLPELKARGKTVIVISHDDTYFDCADRLLTLADGQLRQHAGVPGQAAALHSV